MENKSGCMTNKNLIKLSSSITQIIKIAEANRRLIAGIGAALVSKELITKEELNEIEKVVLESRHTKASIDT